MRNSIHKDLQGADNFMILIDGVYERYCENESDAVKYAALNGNAVVQNINTGKVVARYR